MMADEDDGLGSFFDEISKIPVDEKNLAEAQSKSYDNDDGTRSKRQRLENGFVSLQLPNISALPWLIKWYHIFRKRSGSGCGCR